MLSLLLIWSIGGFDFDELTTTAAILIPLLASHIATIITFSQSNSTFIVKRKTIPVLYALITLTPPILLVILLTSALYLKGFNLIAFTFDQFKIVLSIINAMFGAYVASLVTIHLEKKDVIQNTDKAVQTR